MIRLLSDIRVSPLPAVAAGLESSPSSSITLNREIAAQLNLAADQLQTSDANPYRVRSYRIAAATVAAEARSLKEIYDARGRGGLCALPGIGSQLAGVIGRMLRERGSAGRTAQQRAVRPPVPLLLDIDRDYREQALSRRPDASGDRAHTLRALRDGWDFTVAFSATARARELGRTRDWVVIRARRGEADLQFTAVTETRGRMAGRRVVRGLEHACRACYLRGAAT